MTDFTFWTSLKCNVFVYKFASVYNLMHSEETDMLYMLSRWLD